MPAIFQKMMTKAAKEKETALKLAKSKAAKKNRIRQKTLKEKAAQKLAKSKAAKKKRILQKALKKELDNAKN